MFACLALLASALGLAACAMGDEPEHLHTKRPAPATSGSITIAPRTPLLATYPCSRCHDDRTPDPTERRLTEFHTQKTLEHGTQQGWCYRCHSKENIDKLLAVHRATSGFSGPSDFSKIATAWSYAPSWA